MNRRTAGRITTPIPPNLHAIAAHRALGHAVRRAVHVGGGWAPRAGGGGRAPSRRHHRHLLPASRRLKIQLKQACQIKSLLNSTTISTPSQNQSHPKEASWNIKLQATMWTCQHTRGSTSHSDRISTAVAPRAAATWPRPVLPTPLWGRRVTPLLLLLRVSGPSQTQTLRRQSVQGRNNACWNFLLHVSMHVWAKDYHAGSDWRINIACQISFPRTPLDLVDPPQLQPTRVCWSPLLSASRQMRQDA